MKRIFNSITLLLVIASVIFVAGCTENTKTTITGTPIIFKPAITSSDFNVTSLSFTAQGDSITFVLSYKSGRTRDWSFFNPPSGDKFMLTTLYSPTLSKIQAGTNILTFSVPASSLRQCPHITMKFWADKSEDQSNYLFFNTAQILNSTTAPATTPTTVADTPVTPPTTKANTSVTPPTTVLNTPITFRSTFKSPDFQVHNLTFEFQGDSIFFKLAYTSNKNRDWSFFNPPSGDKLMQDTYDNSNLAEIQAGTNTLTFSVPASNLKQCSNITMKFWADRAEGESSSNFLNFDTSQILGT